MDTECLNIFKKHIGFWKSYPTPGVFFSDTPYVIKNSKSSNIELWVSLYNSSRIQEFLTALNFNVENPAISKINILLEESDLKISQDIAFNPKVLIIPVKKSWRTKYSDIIKLIPTSSKNINIILNSDIVLSYFDENILKGIADDELIVLTRHEITDDSVTMVDFVKKGIPVENCASSDVWIFKGYPQINADICLGIPGCENMFIMDFIEKNYKVYNLGQIIPAYHLHKNTGIASYPFTYFLSKNFKITFIKRQLQLCEPQSQDNEKILDCSQPVDITIKNAVAHLTNVFNEELRQYNTLIDVYNKSLNYEIERIQTKLIDSAKTNIERDTDIFYKNELAFKTEALNKKLKEDEHEFTRILKEQLEKKFNTMYETNFYTKKKEMNERLERKEEEFKKKLESSQAIMIEEYKKSKLDEVNAAIFLHDETMTKKINEEILLSKEAMMAKLMQEMAIKKEESERELNFLTEECDKIFKDKKSELQRIHASEVASYNEEKSLIKIQIEELREEEQALREKNEVFLSKIDESCEEYKNAKISQIEDSLQDIKLKLLTEEEYLQTTISANNQLLDDSIDEIKMKLLSEEEHMHTTILANAEIIENELKNKKETMEIEYSLFLEKIKIKKDEVNKKHLRNLEESQIEIVKNRNALFEDLTNELNKQQEKVMLELNDQREKGMLELNDQREKGMLELNEELETEKKELNNQLSLFKEEIINQKNLILTEVGEFKKGEYDKATLAIDQDVAKYTIKINSDLEQYLLNEQNAKDASLKEYEDKRSSEVQNVLIAKQKVFDQTLCEYADTIQLRMKEEYNKLKFDQEMAIREWNASYSAEQIKLNMLRNEKLEVLSLFAKQTNANIEESTQKISENIKIFNQEYSTNLMRMKEKLSDTRKSILHEHEQLRLSENKRLDAFIKENKEALAKERMEKQEEIKQLLFSEKTKIENEMEGLRTDGTLKIITELNEKREILTSELDDEVKAYRETQIEDIRKNIEENVMAKLEKTISIRDSEDIKSREEERKQFNDYMDNLRQTEIEIVKKTKESTISRLDTRITDLRKQLFELEKNIRDAQK